MNHDFRAGDADARAYVAFAAPAAGVNEQLPILMVHGGAHTGACYEATPDGRTSWAQHFAEFGYPVYVMDWPGHGRSPALADLASLSMRTVVNAVVDAAQRIGPVILMTHSLSGSIGWAAFEQSPTSFAAIVGIAPGPPANLTPALPESSPLRVAEDAPTIFSRDSALHYWANSKHFPHAALEAYLATLVPESARVQNERFNVGGIGLTVSDLVALRALPTLIVTGDQDPRHPYDADKELSDYLAADFIWLPDRGLSGHGHMLMIENGNLAIADEIRNWLSAQTLKSLTSGK